MSRAVFVVERWILPVEVLSLRVHTAPVLMIFAPASQIKLPVECLEAFCRRWGIARLEVFGSVLREDFRPGSDVDFIYAPGPGFRRDLAFGPWGQNRMSEELARIVGCRVDLIERQQIEQHRNWIRRRHILETAQPIYVEG